MLIEKNVILKHFTTFKIGGPAKFFCVLKNLKDVELAVNFIEKNKIKFFILGGGSNLLIKDETFDGIVMKPEFDYLNYFEEGIIEIGGGVNMPELVYQSCSLSYKGLEGFGGLPGTFGGAIRGNAGCFGYEIKNLIIEVNAINLLTKEYKIFQNKDCNFSYRSSFFKFHPEWLIIGGKMKLISNENKEELLNIMREKIEYRKKNFPIEYPNAGSIFKNIEIDKTNEELKNLAKEENVIKGNKIPTAFLIEYLGLKGKQIGGAKISEKHANFIINLGNAKANDVLSLISLIKEEVYKKFNLMLEEEIQIV